MPPLQQRLIKSLQFFTDLGLTGLLLWLLTPHSSGAFSLLAISVGLGYYRLAVTLSHYSLRRPFWDELQELLATCLLMGTVHAALIILTDKVFSTQPMIAWGAVMIGLPLSRGMTRQTLRHFKLWFQPVILIGTSSNGIEAKIALESESTLGYRVIVQCSPDRAQSYLQQHPHALVALALEHEDADTLNDLLRQLISQSRDYLIAPAIRGLPLQGLTSFHTLSHEVLLLRASNHLKQLPSKIIKRLFDYLVSCVLLLFLSPLFMLIALRLSQESGPIIFWHDRVGRHGKIFRCPKFRTMTIDADAQLEALLNRCEKSREEWEATRKLRDDPRVTALGRFLRQSSLDELPQLWCVLKGDMSLVGPRPVTAAEMPHYAENKTYYEQVLPGITGLWQASGRSEADYPTRVALDVWYVRNWSLWTDVVILLKTASVVIQRKGAY